MALIFFFFFTNDMKMKLKRGKKNQREYIIDVYDYLSLNFAE